MARLVGGSAVLLLLLAAAFVVQAGGSRDPDVAVTGLIGHGVDVATSMDAQTRECLHAQLPDLITVLARVYSGAEDAPDTDSVQTLHQARLGGLGAQGMFELAPLQQRNITQSLQRFRAWLHASKLDFTVYRVWFTVDKSVGDVWSRSCQQNIAWLRAALADAHRLLAQPIGIRTDAETWHQVFCDTAGFSDLPLWLVRLDGIPVVQDWDTTFLGAWQIPLAHQYQRREMCGVDVGLNWLMDWS